MTRTNERYAEYQLDGDQVDGPKAVQEAMNVVSGVVVGSNAPSLPDTSLTFDEYVSSFPPSRREGYIFGTGVVGAAGSVDSVGRTIIKDLPSLRANWHTGSVSGTENEFDGFEFNPGGGPDYVCSSFESQPAPAGSGLAASPSCFIFDADCLRLQPVVQYGSHTTYLVGTVTDPGVIVNGVGGTTPCPIARIGKVASDIATMTVGDMVTIDGDVMFITALNQGAGNITLEAASWYSGPAPGASATITETYKAVQFHKHAIARTVTPSTAVANGTAGPYAMATPIPANVVPGMTIMVIANIQTSIIYIGHNRIKSIDRSGANHTFTLEKNVANNGYNGNTGYVLFTPTIWVPQMVSKKEHGPFNCGVYALKARVTLPDCEVTDPGSGVFSGTDVTNWIAAHPNATKVLGCWQAIWHNTTERDANMSLTFNANGKTRERYSELDKPVEVFHKMFMGGANVWTGNTHERGIRVDSEGSRIDNFSPTAAEVTAAINTLLTGITDADTKFSLSEKLGKQFGASRTRILNADRTDWRIPGSKWIDRLRGYPSWADSNLNDGIGGNQRSDGTHALVLPAANRMCTGGIVELSVIWTRLWSIAYINNQPICVTWWDITDQELPHALFITNIMHTFISWAWAANFFIRDTANVPLMALKVHSLDIWKSN